MKLPLLVVILFAFGVSARSARAQGSAAEAEQLFRDAKRLMKEGKYEEACAGFETSNRLEPAVSTLANLGDCREKNAQLASAWTVFLQVERDTRGDKKQAQLNKTAKQRAAALEKRLSYLTVSVPDESRVDGLELLRNDAPMDEGLWNRAIPVDGGTYVIAGRAPGHEAWTTTVTVPTEGGHVTADVPKFKDAPKLVTPIRPADPVTGAPAVPPGVADDRAPSTFTGRRTVALGVGAVGLVAVGGGILLGLQAKSLQDDVHEACPENPCSNAVAANQLVERAERRALYANLSYGVAAVAIITAGVLWFTGAPEQRPSRMAVTPVVGAGLAGLDLTGSF